MPEKSIVATPEIVYLTILGSILGDWLASEDNRLHAAQFFLHQMEHTLESWIVLHPDLQKSEIEAVRRIHQTVHRIAKDVEGHET